MAKKEVEVEKEAEVKEQPQEKRQKLQLTDTEQARLEELETKCLNLGNPPVSYEMKELSKLRNRPHKKLIRTYCPNCKRYFIHSTPTVICRICNNPLPTGKK